MGGPFEAHRDFKSARRSNFRNEDLLTGLDQGATLGGQNRP